VGRKNPAQDWRLLVARRHIEPDGENIRLLAVTFVCRSIGVETILWIPVFPVQRFGRFLNDGPILLGTLPASVKSFHLRRVVERLDELQSQKRRTAIRILRRHAGGIVFGPIAEFPPLHFSQQSVRTPPRDKPVEYRA